MERKMAKNLKLDMTHPSQTLNRIESQERKLLEEQEQTLKQIEEQKKKLQKDTDDALKKLKKEAEPLIEAARIAEQMEGWGHIDEVRAKCEEIIKFSKMPPHLKSLSALDKFPKGNYKYQHPLKTKLKTSNIDEAWVKEWLNEGGAHGGMAGTLEQLKNVALNSRLKAWKKAEKKKIAANKPKKDIGNLKFISGKKDASKDVGVG